MCEGSAEAASAERRELKTGSGTPAGSATTPARRDATDAGSGRIVFVREAEQGRQGSGRGREEVGFGLGEAVGCGGGRKQAVGPNKVACWQLGPHPILTSYACSLTIIILYHINVIVLMK